MSAASIADADDLDFDPGQIPNPLEQTFDKRFVQNPRSPAGGRGFGRGGGGFGSGGSGPAPAPKGSGPKQPDPLQTSMGYIGADAFHRKGKAAVGEAAIAAGASAAGGDPAVVGVVSAAADAAADSAPQMALPQARGLGPLESKALPNVLREEKWRSNAHSQSSNPTPSRRT